MLRSESKTRIGDTRKHLYSQTTFFECKLLLSPVIKTQSQKPSVFTPSGVAMSTKREWSHFYSEFCCLIKNSNCVHLSCLNFGSKKKLWSKRKTTSSNYLNQSFFGKKKNVQWNELIYLMGKNDG